MANSESNKEPLVTIFSAEHGLYWAAGACGYTSSFMAGIYTLTEATNILKSCGPEKLLEIRAIPDVHVPTLKARIAELETQLGVKTKTQ